MKKVTVACQFCAKLNRIDLDRLDAGPKCSNCGKPFQLDRPVKLTDADFDRVIADAAVPVLVDFYADWCGPCKAMAPVLDEIARKRKGSVVVAKLDTDRNPTVAQRFEIRGIPTLILFKQGREAARKVGAAPRGELEAMLERP